jgi:hypothetical protein
MPNTTRRPCDAVRAAAGQPLSNRQKQDICRLARAAWDAQGRPGFADQDPAAPAEIRLSQTEAFELWRHDQQRSATGCPHLTGIQNRDFPHVMARFANLAGRQRDADYWLGRTVGDPQRQALAKLAAVKREVAHVIADADAYVAAIARSRFNTTDLASLSPKQLWGLIFDLRRGAQRKRAAQQQGVPF